MINCFDKMTRFWMLTFWAITHHSALFAQEYLPNGSVIKNLKVRTMTQYDCDSTGNNCFVISRKFLTPWDSCIVQRIISMEKFIW